MKRICKFGTWTLSFVCWLSLNLGASAWAADTSTDCKGWVAVQASPEDGAQISLDGKDTGEKTPITLKNIPCGIHKVEVAKPFYLGTSTQVSVRKENVVKVKLPLRPNYGSVEVTTQPEKAIVTIDGKEVGTSPLVVDRVLLGSRQLQISFPDHRTHDVRLEVKLGKNRVGKVRLSPAFGQVQVTSEPAVGAMIYLDGDAVGKTPLVLNRIASGAHTIQVALEHHKAFAAAITVEDGKTSKVAAVLSPNYATLAIDSDPPGGQVLIDDKSAGKTPMVLKLQPGDHLVKVVSLLAAYGSQEKTIHVPLLAEQRIQMRLPLITSRLIVDTMPYGAKVMLDGTDEGNGPISLKDVPIGDHQISVVTEGLPPFDKTLSIQEGMVTVAEISLAHPEKSTFRIVPFKDQVKPKEKEPETQQKLVQAAKEAPTKAEPTKAEPTKAEPTKSAETTEAGPSKKGQPIKPTVAASFSVEATPQEQISSIPEIRVHKPVPYRRQLAWVSFGTAVATAAAGITLFWASSSDGDLADKEFEKFKKQTDYVRRQEMLTRVRQLDQKSSMEKTAGWICTGLFTTAAGASLYLFLSDSARDSGPSTSLRAALLPDGGWVALEGRF